MNIPKSYEALSADLASEKILSKTLQGQKESYMMLADGRKVELDAALAREAALRAELESRPDISIKNCIFEGENGDGSQAFEYETLDGVIKKLTKINLDGWVCYGPVGENASVSLQQRPTAAEQQAKDAIELLEVWRTWLGFNRESCSDEGKRTWDRIDAVVALKPAAEVARCMNCDRATVEQCDDAGCGFLGAGNGAPVEEGEGS